MAERNRAEAQSQLAGLPSGFHTESGTGTCRLIKEKTAPSESENAFGSGLSVWAWLHDTPKAQPVST